MKTFKHLILILFLISGFCFAQVSDINAQISKMETSIWGFAYEKQDISKRLSRIEKNVFGNTNQGMTKEERIKKLNEVLGYETQEDKINLAEGKFEKEADDVSYPQIDKLEYQTFAQTFEKENIYKRLERLEKKIFGSKQDGTLSLRTDRLKAYIQRDIIVENPKYYTQKPYKTTENIEQYMDSQSGYEPDVHIQIAGLETALFNKTYSHDPIGLRLNRLERKIFQRDFSSDDEMLRIQRLQAAANAQQTAKLYEANKFQKYASSGIQLGSILLMILALIL